MRTGSQYYSYSPDVKAVGAKGVGGLIIRHTDPTRPDLTADYFSAATDHYLQHIKSTPVLYGHAGDPVIQGVPIGMGVPTLTPQGVELKDGQLEYIQSHANDVEKWFWDQVVLRQEYLDMIMQLIAGKNLGWSTGSSGHLVWREYQKILDVWHITRWPIVEVSLTPTPAEPYTIVDAGKAMNLHKGSTLKDVKDIDRISLEMGLNFRKDSNRTLVTMDQVVTKEGRVISTSNLAEIKDGLTEIESGVRQGLSRIRKVIENATPQGGKEIKMDEQQIVDLVTNVVTQVITEKVKPIQDACTALADRVTALEQATAAPPAADPSAAAAVDGKTLKFSEDLSDRILEKVRKQETQAAEAVTA